ncbi:hypothetical protein [Flavobacterium sp. U410]
MKNSLLLLTTLLFSFFTTNSFAQPSDAEIVSLLKGKGAIDVKFTSAKGTVHTTVTEKWYERTAESKWKTEIPNIYRWERSDYRYDFRGGKWSYNRTYFGSGWYDGIPNPTEKEIVSILENSMVGYQGAYFQKPVFKLTKEPKFNWHTFNSVEFNVEAVYFKKVSYTEFQKVKATFPVRLYKDCGNGKYDNTAKKIFKDASWLPVQMAMISNSYGKEEVLETKKISSEEAENLRNMQEMYGDEIAKNQLAAMGSIDIPAFKNDKEAIVWIHNIMYSGDAKKAELMAYHMLSSFYFENGSEATLNERGKQLVENIKNGVKTYATIYCEHPSIKHQQSGMLQFYDRDNYSFGRIAVQKEGDVYKISDLEFAYAPNSSQINACKQAADKNCAEGINTGITAGPEKFNIGDNVIVNWNGQGKDFYTGKITKIDEYNSNRYFVTFDEIQSAWIDGKFIGKRGEIAKEETATQNNTSNTNSTTNQLKKESKLKGLGKKFGI